MQMITIRTTRVYIKKNNRNINNNCKNTRNNNNNNPNNKYNGNNDTANPSPTE